MFKKIFIIFFIILNLSLYSQNEPLANLQIQKLLYNQTKNIKEKGDRIKDIYKVATEEYSDFIISILAELSNYFLENNILEKRNFDEWAYYTILTASKIKIKDATQFFVAIFPKISRVDYKAKILYLIGASENYDFLPFLNSQLVYYNNQQRIGNVKIKDFFVLIEGCLTGLEFFADKSSFSEVFYAITAYNERIKNIATKVRDTIASKNDLSTICDDIIKNSDDLEFVYNILDYSFNSNLPSEKKIINCNSALYRFLNELKQSDLIRKEIINRIKNLAVKNLGELKVNNKESLELIKLKLNYDKDEQSDWTTIDALKKIGSEDSVKILNEKLAFYIKILEEGGNINFEKEYGVKFIKEIVRSLGDIKSTTSLPYLEAIRRGTIFGKPIQDEAEAAITKILKK